MSVMRSLTSVDESEYDRIEAAMSESERGRWFLAEYRRRNRTADTDMLLGAISRLETAVTAERTAEADSDRVGRMRGDLMDMAHAIARTKAEIAAISTADHDQSRLGIASVALDAIIRSTERATSDILGAAEEVQETAWSLRETGTDAAICDVLDRRATEIYTACSFQDLTAQRTARIIHTLRYLEERLAAMIAIWGGEVEAIPPAPGASGQTVAQDLDQSDVDRFIDMDPPRPSPEPPVVPLASLHDEILFVDAPVTDEPEATHGTVAHDDVAETAPVAGDEPEALPVSPPPATGDLASGDADVADMLPEGEPEEIRPADDEMETGDVRAEEADFATPPSDKTDIATAFADIDRLSEDEKRALFS